MIVECPKCKTAHSKGEQDLGAGAPLVCRRCGYPFLPTAASPGATSGAGAPVPPRGQVVPVLGKPAAPSVGPADTLEPLDMALDMSSPPQPASPTPAARMPPASTGAPDLLAIDFGEGAPAGASGAGSSFTSDPALALNLAPALGEPHPGRSTPPAPSRPAAPRPTPNPPTKATAIPARATPPAPARPTDGACDPALAGLVTGADATQPPVDPGAARVPRPSLEARAGKSRGAGAWVDAQTDVIQVKPLARPPATADNETVRRHGTGGAQGNVFPREALLHAKDELLLWVKRSPPKRRYLIIAAVATPPLLWIVLLAWAFWPGHPAYYVTEGQPLLVGPAPGEVYPHLSPVDRGGRVELVDDVGEYALVRDSLGRVGYVRSRDLKRSTPQALPSQPFADCVRAPVPGATEICQRRAQEQFEDCRKVCRRADDASCADHCQKRFSDCLGTCEQLEPETPTPQVAATPRPEPAKAVKRDEPSVPDPAPEATHPKAKKLIKAKKKGK